MGFGPRPTVTQGWVCLGLSYNLGLPSSLALVSHGLNIPLLPREWRQQSRGRHSSGPGLFSWLPALTLQDSWLLVLVSGKVCTLLQSWLISVLPCYSQARKAGLWAGRGCQIFMPALSVGEGLIQQIWGLPGFLLLLHPCSPSLSILCPDPGLPGLKVVSLFCPQNLPFYVGSLGWGQRLSREETSIAEHRLPAHRQTGNLISTHKPQVPCWPHHWAGSSSVQEGHRGGLLAQSLAGAGKRRSWRFRGMQTHISGSQLFSECEERSRGMAALESAGRKRFVPKHSSIQWSWV